MEKARRIIEEKENALRIIKQKIEEDLRAQLSVEHRAELEQKEGERKQVEAKLQEFMGEQDRLLDEKVKI